MVRGTVRVTCFAQEHSTLTRPQVPCPELSTQSTASTIRLPRVPLWTLWQTLKKSLRTLRQITNRRHDILFVQTFFKWLPGSHGCKSVSTLAQPFLYFTQSCLILQREWFSLLAYIGFLFYIINQRINESIPTWPLQATLTQVIINPGKGWDVEDFGGIT